MNTTIKIQVTTNAFTKETEERYVTLPFFCKDGTCHFCKIEKEGFDGAIQVYDSGGNDFAIQTVHHDTATDGVCIAISEVEFAAAYQRVRARMDEKVFGVGEPA